MLCPKCQFDNREGVNFCEKCGTNLEQICPNCNATIPPDRIFCGICGHDLTDSSEITSIDYSEPQSYTPKFLAEKILTTRTAIEGERKLVTVLFADVANYTSIAEKLDPEEAHQIMDGCFKILMDEIHKDEGTINQFTGDGVMALFGAPVAHEDHAQRACYAALSIQKAIGEYGDKLAQDKGVKFKLRIGLNSGPVIVGAIGNDLRMDYTAVGDTTNLGSRMESMAKPGTILISENTHRLVRDFFEFKILGKFEIKGKEEPQEAFELIKAGDVETRIGASMAKGLTRFVGRKNSMAALMDAFDKVKSGSGQVVGLMGEAGVGKSRLLLEMRNKLPQGKYNYLEGRCIHFGGSMAYLPILDILKSYFKIKDGDREFIIKKKIEERILDLDDNLSDVIPPIQELLSLKADDGEFIKLTPKEKRDRTFEALRNLLVRGSEEKPLVIAMEDVHWIDKTSEEFINYVIESLANTSILLILLYRPEYTHQWGSKSYYSKIGLDQLGTQSSAELVREILEVGELAPELGQLILNRAAGNPLFLEEFTHTLIENGSIERKDEKYVLRRKASDIQVPDTIQGIISARMDRLEDNLKRTMQVASVIGRDFAFRILQTTTGMRDELKYYLLNLQGLEFIYEKSLFPELEYIFKHALTQEVAYNSLLQKRRKEIHEKIGEAIESIYIERLQEFYEVLAYHYSQSNNKSKALKYLELANHKAILANAVEEAKTFFDQAMAVFDAAPETNENCEKRLSLLVKQEIVFQLLFKIKDYYNLLKKYQPLADELKNLGQAGAFYGRLGACEGMFGYLNRSFQTFKKAIELSETGGNLAAAGYAYAGLGFSQLFKGNLKLVLNLHDTFIQKVGKRINPEIYIRAITTASFAYTILGQWENALEKSNEAIKFAQPFSNKVYISFGYYTRAYAYVFKRDFVRAHKYAKLAFGNAAGPALKAWAEALLSFVNCLIGEPDKGIEYLSAYVQLAQALSFIPSELTGRYFLGEAYLLHGSYEKARQTIIELLRVAERCGSKTYIAHAHRLLGEIDLETNPTKAASHFDKCIEVFQKIEAQNHLAQAYFGYGRFYRQQGNLELARKCYTDALNIFEKLGTLDVPDRVKKELEDLSNR